MSWWMIPCVFSSLSHISQTNIQMWLMSGGNETHRNIMNIVNTNLWIIFRFVIHQIWEMKYTGNRWSFYVGTSWMSQIVVVTVKHSEVARSFASTSFFFSFHALCSVLNDKRWTKDLFFSLFNFFLFSFQHHSDSLSMDPSSDGLHMLSIFLNR